MGITTLALLAILIIFIFRNISLIRDLLISKRFKKIYQAVLDKDADIQNKFNEFFKEEKNEYLISKAYVLKTYVDLLNNVDVKDSIDKIDYEKIFLKNNKYDINYANLNSDMIIWTLCCFPRLKKQGYLDTIKQKMDILGTTLDKHIEYKVFNAVYSLLNGNKDDAKFLYDLVNGDYSGLNYEKQLIGVTKRIALAFIASENKEKNIEYADELKIFSSTKLGINLLEDLEIYEIYK